MKVIPFDSENELDIEDSNKLKSYQGNVSNSQGFKRFLSKIKIGSSYYMPYIVELDEYYSAEEKNRIIDL